MQRAVSEVVAREPLRCCGLVRVVFSWSLGQNAELKKSQIQNPENENKIMRQRQ
jgi:hypothetical protein